MLPPLADSLFSTAKDGLLSALAVFAIGSLFRVNRLLGIFKDFPPHIHENGKIRFPKGYEPGRVQSLFSKAPGASDAP